MSEGDKDTLGSMKRRLGDFMTRREGDRPVAPVAPLTNTETPTPLQDTREVNKSSQQVTGKK